MIQRRFASQVGPSRAANLCRWPPGSRTAQSLADRPGVLRRADPQMRKGIAVSVRHANATVDHAIVTQLMATRGAGLQPALLARPSYLRDCPLVRVARKSSCFRVLARASTQTFFSALILL